MKVDQELTKLYYSIGEVSEMFGVSNSLIRYWETEFRSLKPSKNRRGDRQYTVKDIRVLERIYTLVKEKGYTLEGAKKQMRSKLISTDDQSQVLQKLKALKSKLEQLRDKI